MTGNPTLFRSGRMSLKNFKLLLLMLLALAMLPSLANAACTPTGVSITTGPTNAVVNVGQYQSFTATGTKTGGNCATTTWTWNAVNSVTIDTIANSIAQLGAAGQTNTWTFYIKSADTSNSPTKANVLWNGFASAYSANYVVHTAQIAGALTESNTIIDIGQSSTLTGNPSGGTAPYTISYFSQASCAGTSIGSGATLSVSPTSTTTYSYNSVDSATTKNVVCSASNSITVSSALGIPSIAPLNPSVFKDLGYIISSDWSGGSPGYLTKLYSSPTSCSSSSTLEQSLFVYANSISFALVYPQANTIYCIYITDSATSPMTTNSISSLFSLAPQSLPLRWILPPLRWILPLHYHGYPFGT